MIKLYPSKLPSEPIESHEISKPVLFEDWLRSKAPSYDPSKPVISVHVNGELLCPSAWSDTEVTADDDVRIYPEPKGAEIIAVITIAAAVLVVQQLLVPRIPKPKSGQGGSGDQLDQASLKGNKVKANDVIREAFGKNKIYADYLNVPHRYFQSPREQVVEALFCVGKGEFDIQADKILIGDTPVISLSEDIQYAIYGPGESLAGDSRADWWHTSSEVGASSTGQAGLELTVTTASSPVATASAFVFNGYSITIPSGAGSFPADWAAGDIVEIKVYYPYTITDGGAGRDTITGNTNQLGFTVGDTIEIAGDNAGDYIVNSITLGASSPMTLNYSNGSPATALATGSRSMSISYRGMRYRIVTASTSVITVERLDSSGATDPAWIGFAPLTSNNAFIGLDRSSAEGGWAGPFTACPDNEVTSLIEYDVFFPSGLILISEEGDLYPWPVKYEIQWRDYNLAGAWTAQQIEISAQTQDQVGYTYQIALPYAMRPEVRLRRIGAKSVSPRVADTIQWYGLKSKLVAPTSYAGVTSVAFKIRGGDRVAQQTESQLSLECTRKLLINGVMTPTRSIKPVVEYIAKDIGYDDVNIDIAELTRLSVIWDARGDFYDNTFDGPSTVKQAINNALQSGFAEMTIKSGLISPVRDEPRTVFDQMYSSQNMTEDLVRQFAAIKPDDSDGVDVEYRDGRSWSVETVQCRLPGDLGRKVDKLSLSGVTDRDRAYRIGMRQRLAQKYRRWQYSWGTELDALNSSYQGYVSVSADVPGYGQSAIVQAVLASGAGHIIRSSEPLNWSETETNVVAIRRPDGSLSGPYVAGRLDDFNIYIEGLDFTPDTSLDIEPPHLQFGTSETWSHKVLISSISPNGTESASIEAVQYDERVYSYDDALADN